ncbi:hypothetical protein A9K66_00215 [Mesorhizobium sp. AA23]|nr:hypothetical protein A9K66_00215 [Mesorhizobium sp. AA23]
MPLGLSGSKSRTNQLTDKRMIQVIIADPSILDDGAATAMALSPKRPPCPEELREHSISRLDSQRAALKRRHAR